MMKLPSEMRQPYKILKYNPEMDSEQELMTAISKAHELNIAFFGKSVEGVDYYFFYTREEFDEFEGEKTPLWLVGRGGDKGIRIFSPKIFGNQKITPGKQQKEFYSVLTHETNHSFLDKLFPNDFNWPVWITEGIAGYVAGQYCCSIKNIFAHSREIELKKLHIKEDWVQHSNYPLAYHFVKYLIDTFGKDKLLALLTRTELKTYEGLLTVFKEIYGQNLEEINYKWISNIKINLNQK